MKEILFLHLNILLFLIKITTTLSIKIVAQLKEWMSISAYFDTQWTTRYFSIFLAVMDSTGQTKLNVAATDFTTSKCSL
jgi:hypothetical protein